MHVDQDPGGLSSAGGVVALSQKFAISIVHFWWVVVICGVLGGCVALGVSELQTPVYRANAVLYVTAGADANSQSAYQGSLASQQRVESYTKLANSDAVISEALKESELSVSSGEAKSAISASSATGTVLLTVSAKSSSPEVALKLSSAVAQSLVRYVARLEIPADGGSPLAKLTVISPASIESEPVSPRVDRNTALGAIVGVLMALLFIVVRSQLDSRIQSEHDLKMAVPVPVLGVLPLDRVFRDGTLSVREEGFSDGAEAVRMLRTALNYVDVDSPPRTILVSSALSGEGKTTTCLSLASSLTELGKRVVVVDADLRSPSVAERLGLSSSVGLSSVVSGLVPLEPAIQRDASGKIDILAAGPGVPNPAELLATRALKGCLSDLCSRYDYVLVDSPPALIVTDAVVLGEAVDGMLLVVRAGLCRARDAAAVFELYGQVGAKVLGVILNGVRRRGGGYGYGYGRNHPANDDGSLEGASV